MKSNLDIYDSIIIGCGPAGMSAALYLNRANKKVLMIEKESIGGQMAKSPLIENYPGYRGSGSKLADKMFYELDNKVEFVFDTVTEIKENKNGYIVKTETEEYSTKTLIWATGCEHLKLGVPGEDADNIHYCVTCDGPLYKDKDVVVIGDANSALQYTAELTGYAKNVTLLTLTNKLFGESVLIKRIEELEADQKITIIKNWKTTEFKTVDDKFLVCGKLTIEGSEEKTYELPCDGVFVAIGQKPNNKILSSLKDIELDEKGYVITQDDCCASSDFPPHNIFAIGDCRQKPFRQVSLACADGVTAAMEIIRRLN